MAALTAAIIGASVVGAAATASASSQAAKAAKTAAATNAATIKSTQDANTALMRPFVESGTRANDAIDAFLGLNGTENQDAAFQKWRDSTGYQFTRDQGLDAINSNLALKSQLKSGAAIKAAQEYGTNLANQFGQQYLGNLQSQQGVGLQAAGQTAATNSSAAGANIQNTNMLAGAKGDNAMTQANAFGNVLNDAVSAYGLGTGQLKTDSSYGGLMNVFGKKKTPLILNNQGLGGYYG